MIKYFSLFSGIGGFELGLEQTYKSRVQMAKPSREKCDIFGQGYNENFAKRDFGIFCIGFSEIDRYATQIYKNHFPTHKEYGDVTNIKWSDVPNFELLVGGFPCQSFSIAGKRGGFNDIRGTLFFEIARTAQEKQPRLLLLENVKGLLSHDKGKTFGIILNTLDELGYDLQWQVLNSKNFGVPQNRERVFIVGHLRGTSRPQVFPIGRLYRETIEIQQEAKRQQKRILRNSTSEGGYFSCPKNWRDAQGRPRIRRLTPTECERLQGFPDNWTEGISDTQRYKCLGNAVTVNVVSAVIERLIDA